ncbi:MAG TPA: chemotaxis protein CheB [Candidatus Acidoferrales bacterium]|nr:chemotaxis protein CheB [Candidatus Acidoferrales bacterium]
MKSKSPTRKKRRTIAETRAASGANGRDNFLIAAIGASAGGIEALTELMRLLPVDTGMAFVLIQHLDPKHPSILAELLSKETAMRVREVTHGARVEPNHVYVIPPNTSMSISGRVLQLAPREESHGIHMSIDRFMRSLAEQQGNRAIGVILSGSGTDGTRGLAEIQAQGGVTFAQDESAKYDGMPRSAIAAGCVDHMLPLGGIARELARTACHPSVDAARAHAAEGAEFGKTGRGGLSTIFQALHKATGVDFTHYRQTTILRRIQRRMLVHKIEALEEYVKRMHNDPKEIQALYQDMLINVTNFFRNPAVFEAMKELVFPAIIKRREREAAIRIWTPGCASGEETYSVAMAALEALGDGSPPEPIQFFGTDVSESSVAKARSGVYAENIRGDVSSDRLLKFFSEVEGGYRISKSIRDMCIFAQHNLVRDPPFSQMDLICCRNVLIYLEPVLQSKVLSLFHYALRPGGYLVLGTSEGLGAAGNLFATEDRAYKIFSKKASRVRQVAAFSLSREPEQGEYGGAAIPVKVDAGWNYTEVQKELDRRLLTHYAPAAAVINEDREILHTRGNVSRYLKLAPGRASLSILKMAREGLLVELRNAIDRATSENSLVRRQNIRIKNGEANSGGEAKGRASSAQDSTRLVNFEVVPFNVGGLKGHYFMVVFEDAFVEPERKAGKASPAKESEAAAGRIGKLEQELAATKEYLQSVIETHEATNEELQSANEEILSSNEELQSTNEELETAKEELQSTNEELGTVNDELRNRNVEVSHANNDLTNLLSSIDIAVIMVGRDLTIRRFTPEAQKILGLIPGDVGRPLLNINPTIAIPEFQTMATQVMSSLRTLEREVADRNGKRYQLRVLPYRTLDNKIDGVVIVLVDVSPRKAISIN